MSEGVEKGRRSTEPRQALPCFYGPPLYRVELWPRPTTNQSRGVVGIITLTPEDFKPSRLSDTLDWLRDLERRFPRVSLVASLPTDAHHELGVALQALLGTYILLVPPPVSLDVLRRVLTTTVGLPQNVARWFRVHADLNVGEAEVIEHLVRAGLDSPAVHRLPELLDPVTRKGLSFVSAAALFTLGRGLGNALALQGREAARDGRRESHEAVALRRGFSTGGALSRHLHNTFSLNARYIGLHLGWSWLVAEWWARKGGGKAG